MIAVIFSLIITLSDAAESIEKAEWFTCQKDTDCITATYLCDLPRAVNKNYAKAFAKHAEKIPGECADEPLDLKPERASCLNSTCQLLFKVE